MTKESGSLYVERTIVVVFGDGDEEGAFGLFGGKAGSLNRIEIRYPDGKSRMARSKDIISSIPKNSIFYQQAGGGGGFGDPRKWPKKVLQEIKNGMVSLEGARKDYGVVVDPHTLTVDQEMTERLRGA